MKKKNYKLHITGRVQGVFYRKSTQETAVELGLKGWVRNEADGTVKVEVEGSEDQLKEFVDWCKEGPPAAKVENVDIEESALKGYRSFEVIR